MRSSVLIAVLALAGCSDSVEATVHACTPDMNSVRTLQGTPFNVVRSGTDATRVELWEYSVGSSTRRYWFRWGTSIEGCNVETRLN